MLRPETQARHRWIILEARYATNVVPQAGSAGSLWLPKFLWPPPPAPRITDPQQIQREYAYYRPRILFWTTVGYAAFYFVRKNLSIAMPVMEKQLGISKSSLGLFLTLHGVLYGISKFGNGILGDRADGRKFMALGLAAAAVLNVMFGFSTAILAFGIIWMINGYFQGMGYPPCARLLAHWFSPKELATKMAYWNASHSLGGAGVLILCGYLVTYNPGNWQICFFVPAGIALAMACGLMLWLRDTPESVGLPEIAGTHVAAPTPESEQTAQDFRAFLWERVFSDKYIWIVSIANFFVYVLRYAIFDWGPTMLKEVKGIELHDAAWMVAGFEFAGLVGIISQRLDDRSVVPRPRCAIVHFLYAGGRHDDLSVLDRAAQSDVAEYGTVGGGRILHLRPAGAGGRDCRQAGHEAGGGHRRRTNEHLRLRQHRGHRLGAWERWRENYGWDYVFGSLLGFAGVGAILFTIALPGYVDDYSRAGAGVRQQVRRHGRRQDQSPRALETSPGRRLRHP